MPFALNKNIFNYYDGTSKNCAFLFLDRLNFRLYCSLQHLIYQESLMNTRKRFTIRTRLLLYFCFLSTISICGLSFIAVFQARQSLTVRIQSNLHTIAEDQAKLFEERYITSPKSNLETLAACPTISDP